MKLHHQPLVSLWSDYTSCYLNKEGYVVLIVILYINMSILLINYCNLIITYPRVIITPTLYDNCPYYLQVLVNPTTQSVNYPYHPQVLTTPYHIFCLITRKCYPSPIDLDLVQLPCIAIYLFLYSVYLDVLNYICLDGMMSLHELCACLFPACTYHVVVEFTKTKFMYFGLGYSMLQSAFALVLMSRLKN